MHVGARLEDLAALLARPHHEGVHRAFDVRLPGVAPSSSPAAAATTAATALLARADDLGAEHLACRTHEMGQLKRERRNSFAEGRTEVHGKVADLDIEETFMFPSHKHVSSVFGTQGPCEKGPQLHRCAFRMRTGAR